MFQLLKLELLFEILLFGYISRYRGQLFGLGDNHTKYKGKYNGNSSSGSSLIPSGQNGHGSMSMQMAHGVHYPQGALQHQQMYMGYAVSAAGDDSINMQEGY